MPRSKKRLLRLATAIHHLVPRSEEPQAGQSCDLPTVAWQQCVSLNRKLDRAQKHGWLLAADRLRRDLQHQLQRLTVVLRDRQAHLSPPDDPTHSPTLRGIYGDLTALKDEFEGLAYDRKEHTLAVTTEPIELDDVYLGAFEISLNLDELATSADDCFRVVALDPHPGMTRSRIPMSRGKRFALATRGMRSGVRFKTVACWISICSWRVSCGPTTPAALMSPWTSGRACVARTVTLPLTTVTRTPARVARSRSATSAVMSVRPAKTLRVENAPRVAKAATRGSARAVSNRVPVVVSTSVLIASTTKKGVANAMKRSRTRMHVMKTRKTSRTTPILRFSPWAYAKLLFLRDYGSTEVGGFGISAADDLFFVTDVQLVQQVCTWAHVAFDDASVADFFDRQVDLGRRPEQFGRIWLHTHPGASAEPSQTDNETFARAFGTTDWAVMAILARGGTFSARLSFRAGPGAEIEIPVEVDYSRPFAGADARSWELEYRRNVMTWIPSRRDTALDARASLAIDERLLHGDSNLGGSWDWHETDQPPEDTNVPSERSNS